uniref:Major sperm protein n=1 Tax=Toxocara canis TaxID=6265 RepID=A0A183V6X0_TOXCA
LFCFSTNDLVLERREYFQRYFTARGLRQLHESSGIEEFTWALVIALITSFYLIIGEGAYLVANAILTIVPIALTYLYPDEKPPNQQLLIYWGAFALLTLLDPSYHHVKGYYFVKVLLLSLLFLRPFNGADRILQHIQQMSQEQCSDEISRESRSHQGIFTKDEIREMERKSVGKKSPPPEPPESTFSREQSKSAIVREKAESSVAQRSKPVENDRYSVTNVSEHTDKNKMERLLEDEDVERVNAAKSASEKIAATSSSSTSLLGSANAYDLCFEPSHHLVFNAPFNDHNLTHTIRVRNTSSRTIAFAVKSNAIQRLSVQPSSGILKPLETLDVAVTVKVTNNEMHRPNFAS